MTHTLLPPLSPLSQSMNTSSFTLYVMGVWELEVPFDKPQTLHLLEHGFVPLSKRFSSIIVIDEKGIQRWRKVRCSVEDHLVVPTFPSGLSPKDYDEQLEEYISNMAMEPLPDSLPPWQVHLITCPTSNAAGTLLFKLNHALGDGYSFMGGLFSSCRRADDPSLPLTFPTASSRRNGRANNISYSRFSKWANDCINTVTDFSRAILGMYFEDDETVLRSRTPNVEYKPVNISSVTFSLDHIRAIKSQVDGATVNDVTTGMIAYALQLYMKKMGTVGDDRRPTAMFAINLRMFNGFKTIGDMLRANIWGNHFVFMGIPLPMCSDIDNVNPLEYVTKSKAEMKKMTSSKGAYFTGKFLDMLGSLRGPKVEAQCIHSSLKNTTIMISNLCGPAEKAAVAGHPIKSLYFTVPGVPQSLVFTIVSYMGKLRMVATTEKGFIHSQLLVSCLKEAFHKIYVSAVGENPVNTEHSIISSPH